MKAITLKEPGGVENFTYSELPQPAIKENEVLVKVKAISINPVDVKTRAGKGMYGRLKDINTLILGWDISGEVVQTGNAVTNFKEGDEVFGMVNFPGHGQAYAEYVASPASHLVLKPENISHEEAAAATLAALTAWQVLELADVKAGQRILVHAAAGGVGHYAVQLAKLRGAYVIGTSSAANRDFVLSLGTDVHIDYKAQPFEDVVKDVDFVFDMLGGDYIDRSLDTMKPDGSIISIPSGWNDKVEEKAAAKGMTGKPYLVNSDSPGMTEIAALFKEGKLKSHVSATFNFDDMAGAHLQVETGKTVGKVVVKVK